MELLRNAWMISGQSWWRSMEQKRSITVVINLIREAKWTLFLCGEKSSRFGFDHFFRNLLLIFWISEWHIKNCTGSVSYWYFVFQLSEQHFCSFKSVRCRKGEWISKKNHDLKNEIMLACVLAWLQYSLPCTTYYKLHL